MEMNSWDPSNWRGYTVSWVDPTCDWKGRISEYIIVTDENTLLDNVEKQFETSEDKTSIAKEMLSAIGIKI